MSPSILQSRPGYDFFHPLIHSLLCGESRNFIGFLKNDKLPCPMQNSAKEDAFFVLGEVWEHLEELIGNDPGWGFEGRSSTGSAKDSFRSNAVDWIINTSLRFGFHSHTTYLSITYCDRFLVARFVEQKWRNAKSQRCPISIQHYVFDSKCMKRMELLILTTLEWRMASVTPYTYLRYFIHKFFGKSCDTEKELLLAAMDLVLTISKEINALDFRPSVVAAAAVLASMGDELTRNKMESKTSSISTGVSLDNEHVYECYRLIQDIVGRRNSKTPGKNSSISSFSDPSCYNLGNGSR